MTRRRLLIVVLAMLLLGGAPPMLRVRSRRPKPPQPREPETTPVDLGEFLVNLADRGEPRYLKAEIVIEVSGAGHLGTSRHGGEASDPSLARLRNAALSVLCSHTYDDLMDEQGRDLLREELAARITQELPGSTVHEVLFSSFVMQ
jgi:flagellar basal body-associated protein FliL